MLGDFTRKKHAKLGREVYGLGHGKNTLFSFNKCLKLVYYVYCAEYCQ